MLNDLKDQYDVYIACGYTDLRFSIDSLAAIIQNKFNLSPFDKNKLFLFCGRRTDRIKGLLWEGDGFLLLYKRLEDGKYNWPKSVDEVRKLTPNQYRWLMEGLTIEPKNIIRNVNINRTI